MAELTDISPVHFTNFLKNSNLRPPSGRKCRLVSSLLAGHLAATVEFALTVIGQCFFLTLFLSRVLNRAELSIGSLVRFCQNQRREAATFIEGVLGKTELVARFRGVMELLGDTKAGMNKKGEEVELIKKLVQNMFMIVLKIMYIEVEERLYCSGERFRKIIRF